MSSNIHLNTEITIFKTAYARRTPFHTDSTSSSEAQREKSDLRRFLEQAETARMRVQSEASSPGTSKWLVGVPAMTAITFCRHDSAPRSSSQAYLRALRARSGKRTSFSAPRTSCTGRMICGHVGELARTWPWCSERRKAASKPLSELQNGSANFEKPCFNSALEAASNFEKLQ